MARVAHSTGDGLKILKMLDAGAKRYEALGRMTQTIIDAVEASDGIDLERAFEESKKGKKALNDQLRVALGLFEIRESDGKAVPKSEAEKLFNNHTKRTNFANMLRKCAQTAAGLIDMNAKIQMDDRSGTLVISGPGVSKEFGNDIVALNEKLVEGLTQKPSFTAIVAIAKRNREILAARGSNTRGVGAVISADSEFEGLCRRLIHSIKEGKGRLSRRQLNALRVVYSEIGRAID